MKDITESRHNIPVYRNELARVFECPRSCVSSHLADGLDDPDTDESIPPSIEIMNGKSSIGLSRTQNKTHES
jgi:hypothetical protein